MRWRVISDKTPLSGAENMARDEAIFKMVEEGISPPTIRLYRWKPSCISLGKHQEIEKELNLSSVRSQNIDIVKRYTGGRAVLHSNEVTYSVMAKNDVAAWSTKLQETYTEISSWLVQSMSSLSDELTLEKGELVVKTPRSEVAPACFASTAKSEIVFSGKKLVGSAQRRTRSAFLQHGSILVGPEHLEIAKLLKLGEASVSEYQANLKNNSCSFQEFGIDIYSEELQNILNQGFLKLFGLDENATYLDEEIVLTEKMKIKHELFSEGLK